MDKRSPDIKIIFNVLIAIIIGFIFGNFMSNTMLNNEIIYASAYNNDDTVYILQTGSFYDETNAKDELNYFLKLGINGVIVKEHDKYYLYHQVAAKASDCDLIISQLDEIGANYFIKERSSMSMLSKFDSSTDEYEFYYQSINYYLILLHQKPVKFINDYTNSVSEVNLELYYYLEALKENYQTDKAQIYQLYVYKSLVELLL